MAAVTHFQNRGQGRHQSEPPLVT